MANVYSYSVSTQFGGVVPEAHVLNETVSGSPAIAVECTAVNVDDANVSFVFASVLSSPTETDVLDAIVAAHVPRVYNSSEYFDAVVDSKFKGDYLLPSQAFAAGHTSVYVRDGTYHETEDIMMPNGGQLVGESQGNVRILFVTGKSCVIDGSNKIEISGGTVSVAVGSTALTGSSTEFTAIGDGDVIQIGGADQPWLSIASVNSDTSLTLAEAYAGAEPAIGAAYVAHNIHTKGTISITHGAPTITGIGTTFTQGSQPMLPGHFVLIGTNYHQVAAVNSDTHLTLAVPYVGASIDHHSYFGQPMYSGCRVSNIVLALSAGPGLHIRGCRNSGFEGVAVIGNTPNVRVEETGDSSFYTFISIDSKSDGVQMHNCFSVLFDTYDGYNSQGSGVRSCAYR